VDLHLEPADIAEWEAEDIAAGVLAPVALATENEARSLLEGIRLSLPSDIIHTELVGYAAERQTPLAEAIKADSLRFDFHLIELPLNVLVPHDRLVRVRLRLDLGREDSDAEERLPVAYDLFPADTWDDKLFDLGTLSVDVTKAFNFVCPVPIGDVLGLKLSVPLKWRSQYVRVRTSDRMSNPVEWYVTDQRIEHGFTAYVILRASKGSVVTLNAELACELRAKGPLGGLTKARYRSDKHTYRLRPSRARS
jgi:hypothetical protein